MKPQLHIFLVLCPALAVVMGQNGGELCTQLYRMSQVCLTESGNKDVVLEGRVGNAGPRGLSGPPGRDAVVDYDIIDRKIGDRCHGVSERLAELEELMTWYRASNGKLYKVFQELANYTTAKAKCQEHGARLASAGVRDPDVRGEMKILVKAGDGNTWFGLNDIEREGTWVWEDGVVSDMKDIDWAPGEPSNGREIENCAIYKKNYSWKINDSSCTRKWQFLCEKV